MERRYILGVIAAYVCVASNAHETHWRTKVATMVVILDFGNQKTRFLGVVLYQFVKKRDLNLERWVKEGNDQKSD